MFERFTKNARHAVVRAQEEARGLKHNYIGTEHVLLGLLGVPDGVAAQALERFGLSLATAREETTSRVGAGSSAVKGHIPFTPRAKKILELALREAHQLHHDYIGTEHVLLGMLREGEGTGAKIIAAHASDLLTVRMKVLDLIPSAPPAHSRRWLRRRSGSSDTQPEELSTTPAADSSLDEAARLAGSAPVGSHHLLLATLADPDTAAARALATLGVDLDQAREALRNADVTGTSDEQPEEKGRRQMLIRVSGDRLTIEAADPAILTLGRATVAALAGQPGQPEQRGQAETAEQKDQAGQADQPGVIRGDLPDSVSLSHVWQALRDSLEDICRRATVTKAADQLISSDDEAAAS